MFLYEINVALESLNALFLGEVPEGLEHLLNEDGTPNEEAIQKEIENLYECKETLIEETARLAQNLDAEARMIKAEEERLAARRKKVEDRVSRIHDRLTEMVEGTNWASKVSSLKLTFRASESLVVDNEEEVNPSFIRTKVVTSVDKVAAKKAIKEGKEVGGCHIEKRKNLTIK